MEKEYEELYFTEEQLCQLSRAELKICDHPDFNSIEDFDFDCVEADAVIDVTFEDMVMAVKNLKNYSPSEFVYDWYIPTFETLSDHIKFQKAIGTNYKKLSMKEKTVREILDNFDYFYNTTGDDLLDDDLEDEEVFDKNAMEKYQKLIKEQEDIIEYFKYNSEIDNPLDWKLTDQQKMEFIEANDIGPEMADFSEIKKERFRRYTEELVNKGWMEAIKVLAYAYYGDENPLYPCDWEKSKELLLTLFEEGSDVDQALAANTLGYIYYYGRCNGGTPQYEEAFKYFSIGAFFGVDESIYKIGDMFLNGKGVPKNRTTARHLYHKVYDTTLPNFEDGVLTGKFADAALRLGGYYEKGSEENPMLAYTYYLEACFAINCRTAVEYNYGDSVVARRVREGLERVKHSLIESETINENATEECRNIVNMIRILTEGDYKLAARLKEEGEEYKLTLIRVNDEEDEDVCPALITFPDIGIVRLLKEINLYLEDADVIEGIECLEDTRIGYVDYHVDRGLELHDVDGELILRVSSPIARVKKLDFYSLYD